MSLASLSAVLLAEPSEEAFLGVPMWIWQLANLVAFLGVLGYFVARPLAQAFRRRQQAVEDRIVQSRKQREEAARLETEIHERMAQLDRDLAEVKARGLAEGEEARATLIRKADEEAERVRREAEEEIGRRLASAKEELRRAAANLITGAAIERLSAEITEEDRRRLLADAVKNLPETS